MKPRTRLLNGSWFAGEPFNEHACKYVPIPQSCPIKPSRQLQRWRLLSSSSQVPPFLQSPLVQFNKTANKVNYQSLQSGKILCTILHFYYLVRCGTVDRCKTGLQCVRTWTKDNFSKFAALTFLLKSFFFGDMPLALTVTQKKLTNYVYIYVENKNKCVLLYLKWQCNL